MATPPESNNSYSRTNRRSYKTNFGTDQTLTLQQVRASLETKSYLWLTGDPLTEYQAMLLDTPEVITKTFTTINPVSLMPVGPAVSHSCEQVISQTYTNRQDISYLPLKGPEEVRFTDGSGFVQEGY